MHLTHFDKSSNLWQISLKLIEIRVFQENQMSMKIGLSKKIAIVIANWKLFVIYKLRPQLVLVFSITIIPL